MAARLVIALALAALVASPAAAAGRALAGSPGAPAPMAKPAAKPAATYATLAESVRAASAGAPSLSILLKAVSAAGAAGVLTDDATVTILAPTDAAFTSRLKSALGITPAQLLEPANKATLLNVLSYHLIPGAALPSSALKNGEKLPTALKGAELTVAVKRIGGKDVVGFQGAANWARVEVADIKAGKSFIHVIDDVLLPPGVGKAGNEKAKAKGMGQGMMAQPGKQKN
ncbi:hypothetical protein HT031_002219 [Scenedesmus sp. PABB004]|nr:hypothetical protein HT031_002219 [Scenedesmus sp. PABB004]